MRDDTAKCSAALLKMCLGRGMELAVESVACEAPALLVLAVLPTLAGEGRGDKPPRKGDLD